MSKKPAISVIVPVYNIATHLAKSLDSILNQTFTNIEVIVVNDGSTDKSGDICDAYAKRDKRIKVTHIDKKGVSAARNVGIKQATGDFIGFVDGDDYIEKEMYQTLYELCIDTNSDIAICGLMREIDGKRVEGNNKDFIKELDQKEALQELFLGEIYRFSLCNKLFSKTCFHQIAFPEGRLHEDLSTTYKLIANAKKCVYTNFVGYIYVKRKNSILTSKFHQGRLDAFTAWDEILPFMKKYQSELLKEVYACYGYWVVDNVYYVINQTDRDERKKYLKYIQQQVNPYYKELLRNNMLSLKYKYIVFIINFNIQFILLSSRFRESMRSNITN